MNDPSAENDLSADDTREILNRLGLFARIIDARQYDRVGEIFAADLTFNYGDNKEQCGLEALLDLVKGLLEVCGPTQHLLGSIILKADGPAIMTRSYVQAQHQGAGARRHLFFTSNGEYVDRWERRHGGWRIVRRDATWPLQQGDPAVLGIERH